MKEKKQNSLKYPGVTIDNSLDKYDGVVLFPEKLKKANESLKKPGLPKEIAERQISELANKQSTIETD